jgi:hypothetical protein
MSRSVAEIEAEARRLSSEAQSLIDSAIARTDLSRQEIANTEATAQAAQVAAAAAIAAAALPNNVLAAEGQCSAARNILVSTRNAHTQIHVGTVGGDPRHEWKECRASIDRFDKLLVDLRKTGFGFITTIVGAAALFVGVGTAETQPSAKLKFVAFVIIGLLIVTLFGIDRTHQAWLRAAVARAMELEISLNYKITQNIHGTFKGREAVILGLVVYLILFLATCFIFWELLDGSIGPYRSWTFDGGVAGLLFILVAAYITHRS